MSALGLESLVTGIVPDIFLDTFVWVWDCNLKNLTHGRTLAYVSPYGLNFFVRCKNVELGKKLP